MNAGLPGVGLAGLFFIVSALVMPIIELFQTLAGRGSRERWRAVLYNWFLAAAMVAVFVAMGWTVSVAAPRSVARQLEATIPRHVSALAITLLILVALLFAVQFARLVRRPASPARPPANGPDTARR